jgi:regulator of sigma E protease
VSWVLAALGFMVLIVLHELGHFAAAKAVGMRVERFALFFPPLLFRKKIGETEYAIGAIPAGGYVKITGMNPSEELSDEERTRAYYSQPVWKRIVVIAAGPLVNLVVGLLLLVIYTGLIGPHDPAKATEIGSVQKNRPATGVLHPGDKVVAINGIKGTPAKLRAVVNKDRCPGKLTPGCKAAKPVAVTIERDGKLLNVKLTPVYDATKGQEGMRLGFAYNGLSGPHKPLPLGEAVDVSFERFWFITKQTVSLPAKIIDPKERKQINGIVGSYETTRQVILADAGDVFLILAVISLSLAIVNLFPFLPLDGGHIFWAIVEKVRRKPVSYSVMERSGMLGFVLVLMLFAIGLSNDISVLSDGGFKVR